ncbi:unnamed protein product, partial [Gulo gulo]
LFRLAYTAPGPSSSRKRRTRKRKRRGEKEARETQRKPALRTAAPCTRAGGTTANCPDFRIGFTKAAQKLIKKDTTNSSQMRQFLDILPRS